jgi:hypothetical protein
MSAVGVGENCIYVDHQRLKEILIRSLTECLERVESTAISEVGSVYVEKVHRFEWVSLLTGTQKLIMLGRTEDGGVLRYVYDSCSNDAPLKLVVDYGRDSVSDTADLLVDMAAGQCLLPIQWGACEASSDQHATARLFDECPEMFSADVSM